MIKSTFSELKYTDISNRINNKDKHFYEVDNAIANG